MINQRCYILHITPFFGIRKGVIKMVKSTKPIKEWDITSNWEFIKICLIVFGLIGILSVPRLLHQHLPIELQGKVISVDGQSIVVATENDFGYMTKTYIDTFESTTRDYAVGDDITVQYKNDKPIAII